LNPKFRIQDSTIVLCAGPKTRRGEHDYPLWQKRWSRLLAMAMAWKSALPWKWPSDEQWKTADVIAFFSNNPDWNAEHGTAVRCLPRARRRRQLFPFAVDGHAHGPELAERIGYAIAKSACNFGTAPSIYTAATSAH
jgi:hypothetical protein